MTEEKPEFDFHHALEELQKGKAHDTLNTLLQLKSVSRALASNFMIFEIVPDMLIRVELWRGGRHVK